MAKFRMVQTGFWHDPKVIEEMTPEDKFFFIYLLTNPQVTQIGIYRITKKLVAFETGFSIETVQLLFERFIHQHDLIRYNDKTREVAIKNWGKYNLKRGGKPMLDCIQKELEDVKDTSFIDFVGRAVDNPTIHSLFASFSQDHDDTSTLRGQEEEQEQDKEQQQDLTGAVFTFYEENIGVLNPFIAQSLSHWLEELEAEVIILAMKKALRKQKKWDYAEGILKRWVNDNLTSLQAIEARDVRQQKRHRDSSATDLLDRVRRGEFS
ncbi:DnaD domain-containing protein [Halalkalibacter hemicellulosilyticus]|uniref:Phage replication protein n=1 Tax=Halalkalibacter hemicellulosilyticusJCM 9152 TaxID=1236971 RepID=W4QJH5_9BACI|nr:DnaD domain protein [Halalkalibacter hemicellulosilyticus]GAE31788.1 phage replication protein [Halalkalibacter hemicellulosilyticusJCM 9152]